MSQARQRIIEALRSRPSLEHLTWPQRRAFRESLSLPMPADVETERVTSTARTNAELTWLDAPGVNPEKAVIYFHGGGYAMGSLKTHGVLQQSIGRAAGVRMLAVDYRLAPEDPFPAALEDGVGAVQYAYDQGFAPGNVAVAGDSAGGGLAVAVLLALRERGIELPAGVACLSPWADLTQTAPSITERAAKDPMVESSGLQAMAELYLAGHSAHDPLVSPLYGDLAGLPPLLVQVGTDEVLFDDATRLARRAQAAGVPSQFEEWPEMFHVFQAFPTLPESALAIRSIARFLRGCLAATTVVRQASVS